ncbi:Prophage CP4-57 integrase [uncultured Avibacterium sp.]|uniref:Prophage CP4-57 integrase n=4 Tax=Avibacterium TaxID=292486 RepID=A0A486XEJ9_9PAST|nr:Prophage CP4-57 integrase [uncultured Avibacterium sp.]
MARIIQPLTNTQAEKAKFSAGGRNELNDGGGLFLQLTPTGSKIWRIRYDNPATGKRTKLTLGNYPELSLAQARTKRKEIRALLVQGIDPKFHLAQAKAEQAQKLNNTFLAIAEQWRKKRENEIKPLTMLKNWRRLEMYLFPILGNYPVTEINSPLLVNAVKPLDEKGYNDTLHRMINLANQILDYAVTIGALEINPCYKASGAYHRKPQVSNAAIHYSELPALMRSVADDRGEELTKYLFKWELLSMVRPSEAVSVEWSEIDFEKNLWHIPAEKMKKVKTGAFAHTVPLSSQMIDILKQLRPITGTHKFVFPSFARSSKPKSMSKGTIASALRRMGYTGEQTAHGLRTVGRTYLEDQMTDHRIGESCLAHKIGDKTSRTYNRADYVEQRRPAMQQWGDYVEQCAKGTGLFD